MKLDNKKLRIALISKGINQKELSQIASVSYSMLSAVMNGRACSDALATRLADALDVTLDELRG